MLFKENWSSAKEMLEAYWHQENEERCLLSFTVADGKRIPRQQWQIPPQGRSLEEHWLDGDKIIERYIEYFENTCFPAEAIPFIDINLGPGITAAYFGCPAHLMPATVWFEHIVDDWEKDSFTFDKTNIWWEKTKELTKKASEAGKDKFFVGVTDLSGVADIIAHLRGTEELCYDLIDEPATVIRARDKILGIWYQCLDELYAITQSGQKGSVDWLGIWAPDKHHTLQCDFASMLSPTQFEKFFLPEIQEQCKKLPYSMFHLDGPDCVRHLDLLLDIPELNAVQWQPGAGQPRPAEGWIPLLKKIQEKGKSIYVDALFEDVPVLLEFLSPKGLYINIPEQQAESIAEADEFIRKVERLSRRR